MKEPLGGRALATDLAARRAMANGIREKAGHPFGPSPSGLDFKVHSKALVPKEST